MAPAAPLIAMVAFLAASARAQIVAIGPFAGAHSDDFESQALQLGRACIQERVLGERADLCSLFGASCSIADAASSVAQSVPRSGVQMFHTDVVVEIVFDRPIRRFGGWFASDWVDAGAASFYDVSGQAVAWLPIQMQPCTSGCAWVWNGWDLGANQQIVRVVLDTATATGGHFELEDLELDFACGAASTYCTAKANSAGCTPRIATSGSASASAGAGFVVSASQVLNQKTGLLLYGANGPAAAPFHGGYLCSAPPRRRTPPQSSNGSASGVDCTGLYAFDFNAWAASGIDPALVAGAEINAQFWSRDPGFAPPHGVGLTDAAEFVLCP